MKESKREEEQTQFLTLQKMLSQNKRGLTSAQLESLIYQLSEYKIEADQREKSGSLDLLLHFLQHSRQDKANKLRSIQRELECLESDIDKVEAFCLPTSNIQSRSTESMINLLEQQQAHGKAKDGHAKSDQEELQQQSQKGVAAAISRLGANYSKETYDILASHPGMKEYVKTQMKDGDVEGDQGDRGLVNKTNGLPEQATGTATAFSNLASNKKRKIASQFDDLQNVYLRLRADTLKSSGEQEGEKTSTQDSEAHKMPESQSVGAIDDSGLKEFSKILSTLTHCNKLKIVAEVPRPSLRRSSSIISSVEFDREGKLFATAGVSKRISIFDHLNILRSNGRLTHCPVVEMVTRSKLSCLSWNRFISSQLASTDYEGVLNIWDATTGNMTQEYEAHAKRIWSVDCCYMDPSLLVTGSDDCLVKLWSTKSPASIGHIDVKANVCAVKWHPTSPNKIAVGSADHSVYLYDLRRQDQSLKVFSGHRKAVSYVRWTNTNEIVSASTDSTLRLWDTEASSSVEERIFRGHINEKNFVGMAVEGDFIACGSETHEAYVYYKPLSKPIAQAAISCEAMPTNEREKPFVSAVCWRPGMQEMLVANSQGSVSVLRLVGS